MFAVLFASLGSFVEEISSSIIKFETDNRKESVYAAGFINSLFGILIFIAIAFWRKSFIFSLASLPTFIPRAILEIFQAQMTMLAIMKADRSTYSFVRNLTIPLLIIVDFLIGYSISFYQLSGIILIIGVIAIILFFHIVDARGIGYSLFTAVNAVITISITKYNITHFNSVEGEQIVISLILLAYFFLAAKFFSRENPLAMLKNKILFGQGVANGISSIFGAFAISFGNAGIVTAASRASAVLAGIISGHNYFQEKKFGAKILVSLGLIIGLALLTQ